MSGVKKLARKVIPKNAVTSAERQYRLVKAKTAYTVYGYAPKKAKVIAVTGTNGKTTTCAFINAMLKGAGFKTAVYTTAFVEIDGKYEPNTTHMTVASPWSVQKFFKRAKNANVDWVILEVTSHALDQYRIYGVPVEVAVITNLSPEHLDYHKTMDNYAAAKARLIIDYKPKYTVLNADDEWYEYFGRKVKKNLLCVGKHKATHQIKNITLRSDGTDFMVISSKGQCDISMKLVGDFNVYNAAQTVAVGQAIGLSSKQIAVGINELPVVAGRLESVDVGQDFAVLVDYAHTPDAIKNVLMAAKSVTAGKVRIVFGATGVGEYARDTTKRGPMGEIAAKYADYIYLTDDETYLEDPEAIRGAIEQGILHAGGRDKYIEIGDRRDAIKQAFKDAKKGDVVLLCGIGHQDYRAMAGKKEPWDERLVAREILLDIRS